MTNTSKPALGTTADDFDLHPGWLTGVARLTDTTLTELRRVLGGEAAGPDDRLIMMVDSLDDELIRRGLSS